MNLEEPRLVDSKPILLAGLNGHFTFQTIGEIPKLWDRFGPEYFGKVPGQVGMIAYGISHEMDDKGFQYMAAVEVPDASNLPEGFETKLLPAQRYAVFPFSGHISRMSESIHQIWSQWLPSSGHAVVDSPVMLERYGETFDPEVGSGDIELWLPIKS
jgi:AraC family transcriptional regulator